MASEARRVKFSRVMATALDVATIAAIGYTAVALLCAERFGRREPEPNTVNDLPRVSLLVPLHGDEAGLEENLRAFALQEYPAYQVVLGVTRADDRALAVAQRVAAAFPNRNIEINVGEAHGVRNPRSQTYFR